MHTCQMVANLAGDIDRFEKIKKWSTEQDKDLQDKGFAVYCWISVDTNGEIKGAYIELHVDALRILGKRNTVSEDDFVELKNHITKILKPWGLSLDDFKMMRIDYCHNCVLSNPDERSIIFNLLNKLPIKMLHMKRENCYKDSVYLKNKSKNINLYDKEAERRIKWNRANRRGNDPSPFVTQDYEKGVIRLEIQLKREHLHYMQRRHISRSPEEWMTYDREKTYLQKLQKVIPTGDFYSITKIAEILKKSNLTNTICKHLMEYLTCVDTFDMTTATQKYSYNSIRRYRTELEKLGIFPVPIPADCGVDYLPSPLWVDWDQTAAKAPQIVAEHG